MCSEVRAALAKEVFLWGCLKTMPCGRQSITKDTCSHENVLIPTNKTDSVQTEQGTVFHPSVYRGAQKRWEFSVLLGM